MCLPDGWTALHYACDNADSIGTEIAGLLLDAGASYDVRTAIGTGMSGGQTPLLLALDASNQATVKLLLEAGASVNLDDTRGITPLHIAAKRGLSQCAAWLLSLGAWPDGYPPSPHKLQQLPAAQAAAIMAAAAAEPGAGSPLRLTAGGGAGRAEAAAAELAAPRMRNERTPLHVAATSGAVRVAELLLKSGADANAREAGSKETALHIAARSGSLDMALALVQAGANMDAVNVDGDTPGAVARRYGHGALWASIRRAFNVQKRFFLLKMLYLLVAGRAEIRKSRAVLERMERAAASAAEAESGAGAGAGAASPAPVSPSAALTPTPNPGSGGAGAISQEEFGQLALRLAPMPLLVLKTVFQYI